VSTAEPCPRCGEPLPPGANFCPNCGAPVAVSAAAERRVVTVVFVDLAGSTELAARLDPERFREVIAAFHGMVTDEISWVGGVAEGFIGDAVLGVFGIPVARDDDAVRAIRAASSSRDRAEHLGKQLGLPIPMRVRIGVNTGPVAVGTATDRNIVIGAEVNVGARLQQAAEPGEILAGRTTVQLAGGLVEFGDAREIPAKGFDDHLTARPVLHVLERPRGDRSRVPLVNRRRELALLNDIFERAASRRRAHLVTLLGEPGIGKSRVAEEFLARLPEGTKVLSGRSSPFEESVTFWPLAQMLYREIGEERDASEDRVLERLGDLVRARVPDDELERAVRRLGLALGVGGSGGEEDRYHLAEVRSGVLTWLTAIAADDPIVMVFEDLQQADPLLLDLIEQLVKEARRVPLMVVCVARWDFLEERPNWAGGIGDAATLWVEPLAEDHGIRLAMEAGGLDWDAAERVARHAGGNPFFIVEITGMMAREQRDLPPSGATASPLLPATVQAVIAARIDQLSRPARTLVRRASIFPRGRFDEDELAIVSPIDPDALVEAEDEELLIRDPSAPGVWGFHSDVLRDVAYESLAKRERQRLHLLVADALSAPGSADRYPRAIAFHLEQAARAASDLDPKERTLADRAVDALAHAGDIARRRIESRAAADLYARALALAGPEETWDGREAWIVSMLGEARYWLGDFDEAAARFRKALSLAEQDDRVIAHAARFLADITMTIRGDDHLAGALFERSIDAARRLGDPRVLARSLLMAGWVPFWQNRLREAEGMFREALEVARSGEGTDAWAEVRALVGIANVTSFDGDESDALEVGLEALVVGETADQPFSIAVAHQVVGASLRRLLRLDEALEHADASVVGLRELGARWELASALADRGTIHRLRGDLESAEADLREGLVLCRELNDRALVGPTAAELGRTLIAGGDLSAARSVLDDPHARTAEEQSWAAAALLTAEAAAALAEDDHEGALAKSLAALERSSRAPVAENPRSAAAWWTGSLFGAAAAGGDETVEDARKRLDRNGWRQALREPQLVGSTGVGRPVVET
jgi:class 3 adenylate cyclase/tetratricopeptide (TPR) repeat protein